MVCSWPFLHSPSVVERGAGIDFLHVVETLEHIDQFLHPRGIVAGQHGLIARFHRHAAEFSLETGGGERFLDRHVVIRRAEHFHRTIVVVQYVVGAGFDRRLHQRALIDPRREQQLPAVPELKSDATIGAEIAAVLVEGMTNVGDSARPVVGQAIDDHRRAADAVTFVTDFDVIDAVESADAFLDRIVDLVLGHVDIFALVDRQTQPGIEARVTTAHLGGDGDFLGDFGKCGTAFLILPAFAVLDVGPLGMSCHADP